MKEFDNLALDTTGAQTGGIPHDAVEVMDPTQFRPQGRTADRFDNDSYKDLEVTVDSRNGVVWLFQKNRATPIVTMDLLRDLTRAFREVDMEIAATGHPDHAPRYMVLASDTPGVFNLGGDLDLFSRLISDRNEALLRRYAHACVDMTYQAHQALDSKVVTITLVQGEALGGGFEAAMAANVLIAERSSRFGLPEILFGLFPGMGAYTFLSRRVNPSLADRMITSGRVYTAEELYDMGVVDVLAEDGMGIDAVHDYVRKSDRKFHALKAIHKARNRVNPITRDELIDITELWIDAAMKLTDADLKMMRRLVAAQRRRHG